MDQTSDVWAQHCKGAPQAASAREEVEWVQGSPLVLYWRAAAHVRVCGHVQRDVVVCCWHVHAVPADLDPLPGSRTVWVREITQLHQQELQNAYTIWLKH